MALRRFGDDSGDDLVSLPEFHGLSGMEPGLELPGVTKLADIHLGHISSWHEMWHIVEGEEVKSEFRALLLQSRELNFVSQALGEAHWNQNGNETTQVVTQYIFGTFEKW
jgi:hypothetical protein